MSVDKIDPLMLSERFRHLLKSSDSLDHLKNQLVKAIDKEIEERIILTDDELKTMYSNYCKKYNLRRNCSRCVKKFREYYLLTRLDNT